MEYTPGMKVAHRMNHRPDLVVIGYVTEDGQHVQWVEVIDSEGRESNRYGGGFRFGNPVPINGEEVPCPEEWWQFFPKPRPKSGTQSK